MKNAFIITGYPRSGTTMLAAILNRHSKICVTPETCYFEDVEPVIKEEESFSALLCRINKSRCVDLGVRLDDDACGHAWSEGGHASVFELMLSRYAEKNHKECVAEKSPIHLLHLEKIKKKCGNKKIIVILRDGRAVVDSLMQVPWSHKSIIRHCSEWCYWMDRLKACLKNMPENILLTKYEDLVDNTEFELKRIVNFIGYEYEGRAMLLPDAVSGVVPEWELAWKGLSSKELIDKKHTWRKRSTKKNINIMESIMGSRLLELGYSAGKGERRYRYLIMGYLFTLSPWYLLRSYIRQKKLRYGY